MISSELLLFFCAFVASASAAIDLNSEECGVSAIADRIINGKPAQPHMWPWQVFVFSSEGNSEFALCGGSLINDQWIVTAAHCLENIESVYVRLGQYKRPKSLNINNGDTIQIELAIQNPNFNPNTIVNDIALLKMPNPITFTDKVSPICLPMKNLALPGRTAVAIGWGTTQENTDDQEFPNVLMQVRLPIHNINECQMTDVNPEDQICAGVKSNNPKKIKDTCEGDSGGPLMILSNGLWYLSGIVSYGPDGNCDGAGIYTNVFAYMDWITSTIEENADYYYY